MSEFVRKAMMGYKEVPGGYEDPECTHVILTKQEYADQLSISYSFRFAIYSPPWGYLCLLASRSSSITALCAVIHWRKSRSGMESQ